MVTCGGIPGGDEGGDFCRARHVESEQSIACLRLGELTLEDDGPDCANDVGFPDDFGEANVAHNEGELLTEAARHGRCVSRRRWSIRRP